VPVPCLVDLLPGGREAPVRIEHGRRPQTSPGNHDLCRQRLAPLPAPASFLLAEQCEGTNFIDKSVGRGRGYCGHLWLL
jgi:hypothetical protein